MFSIRQKKKSLWFLEDIHLIDRDSASVLLQLLERAPPSLVMVLSCRPPKLTPDSPMPSPNNKQGAELPNVRV